MFLCIYAREKKVQEVHSALGIESDDVCDSTCGGFSFGLAPKEVLYSM